MRLPTDVLLSILDALPRDSLDTVAIGNRLLSELCTTNFREYPLRLTDLTVDCRSRAGTASVVTDKYKAADGKHLHANLDSLGRYLSQATLRYLSILGAFDERILELLLPFRDRFR